MNLIWIPGWQFSKQAFQPLWQALKVTSPPVLDYAGSDLDLKSWLDFQAGQLPEDSVLVGWSLGGMLACELARRSDNVSKVLAICSNTQFAGEQGLPVAVAESFMDRYQRNPDVTRRKFAALVDRQRPLQISDFLLAGNHLPTLQWLYDLKITDGIPCPMHVLLADNDQLVPAETAQPAWRNIAQTVSVLAGEHSLPITQSQAVADWMNACG